MSTEVLPIGTRIVALIDTPQLIPCMKGDILQVDAVTNEGESVFYMVSLLNPRNQTNPSGWVLSASDRSVTWEVEKPMSEELSKYIDYMLSITGVRIDKGVFTGVTTKEEINKIVFTTLGTGAPPVNLSALESGLRTQISAQREALQRNVEQLGARVGT